MQPVTEAKRKALLAHKHNPCAGTFDTLRAARSKAQQTAAVVPTSTGKTCAPRSRQQPIADTRKECTKASKQPLAQLVPRQPHSKPRLARSSADQSKQLQRWVEHYLELYSTQNIVTDAALDALPSLPVMEELDDLPTLEELSKTSTALPAARLQRKMGSPQKSRNTERLPSYNRSTSSSAYAGNKATSHKTCETQI